MKSIRFTFDMIASSLAGKMEKLRLLLLPTLLFAVFTPIITGCDGAIESEYKEQVVVQGFIYEGQSSVDSVILHYTTPFGALYDDSTYAITGADVRVSDGNKEYQLQPLLKPGRYGLNGIAIDGGKTYTLKIKAKDHVVTASTTVPKHIDYIGLDSSLPTSKVLELDTGNAFGFYYLLTAGPVDEPGRKYMMEVSALDTTYGKIPTGEEGPPVDTAAYVRYSFIQTAPKIIIYSRLFGWFGRNMLRLLALDSNWVDYKRAVGYGKEAFYPYQSSLNHVAGGIGVWASAAKDDVVVFVKLKI
jgi:hypothetical protein